MEREVDLSQGEAGATSVLDKKFGAANAFKRAFYKNKRDRSFPWVSGSIPATVFIKLPNAVKVSAFSFRSRPEPPSRPPDWFLKFSPLKFELVGSNDCDKWTTIILVESTTWTTHDQERKWGVPEKNRKPFTCIGFKVLTVGWKIKPKAAIQDAKFWGNLWNAGKSKRSLPPIATNPHTACRDHDGVEKKCLGLLTTKKVGFKCYGPPPTKKPPTTTTTTTTTTVVTTSPTTTSTATTTKKPTAAPTTTKSKEGKTTTITTTTTTTPKKPTAATAPTTTKPKEKKTTSKLVSTKRVSSTTITKTTPTEGKVTTKLASTKGVSLTAGNEVKKEEEEAGDDDVLAWIVIAVVAVVFIAAGVSVKVFFVIRRRRRRRELLEKAQTRDPRVDAGAGGGVSGGGESIGVENGELLSRTYGGSTIDSASYPADFESTVGLTVGSGGGSVTKSSSSSRSDSNSTTSSSTGQTESSSSQSSVAAGNDETSSSASSTR